MKTMECVLCDRVILVFHYESVPTAAEWSSYLDIYTKNIDRLSGVLVITEGGAPNSAQRKQLSETYEKTRQAPVAIVSDSAIARGAITAFRWLGMVTMTPFSPARLDEAMEFVKADPGTRTKLRAEIQRFSTGQKILKAR